MEAAFGQAGAFGGGPSRRGEEVPLVGEKLRKYTLADIAKHRGLRVDELLERSVAFSLERSNFNTVDEVANVLVRSDLATAVFEPHGGDIAAMMSRRHWIVHRADRNQAEGSGQFAARSLSPKTVKTWVAAVEAFGKEALALL